ncbi:hypothetical protein ACFU7T_11970 [Streptomyces sp. NPDC057555]
MVTEVGAAVVRDERRHVVEEGRYARLFLIADSPAQPRHYVSDRG